MNLWESLKYEVWWLSETIPRLRFCKGRWYCPKLVAAYPFVRPTLCHKHRVESRMAATERIRNCAHERTRPNPNAVVVLDQNPRVCLDCGVGIIGPRSAS